MKILINTLLLLLFTNINSQTLDLNKQKTFDYSSQDNYSGIFEVGDFYFVIGHKALTTTQMNVHVLKVDKNFNFVSEKTFGTANFGFEFNPISTMRNDTIFISVVTSGAASGDRTMDSIGGKDIWVFALNSNLDIIWQNLLGGTGLDETAGIITMNNKNLLVASISSSGINGNKTVGNNVGAMDPWFIEIDFRNGNIINQQAITNDNDQEEIYGFFQNPLSNKIYFSILASSNENGFFSNPSYGLIDTYVVEYDENLVKLSDENFGGDKDDVLHLNFHENNFYLSGLSYSSISGNKTSTNNSNLNKSDGWFLKLDDNLNILQDKMFGGSETESFYKLIFKDNKMVITGLSNSVNSGNKISPNYGGVDAWVLICDLDGNILAQNSYGGSGNDYSGVGLLNSANDIILAAWSNSPISGVKTEATSDYSDLWLLELETTSILNINETVSNFIKFEPFPNPFENKVNFNLEKSLEDVNLSIFNAKGQTIFERKILAGENFIWSSEIENQVLFYKILGSSTNYTGKIVKM